MCSEREWMITSPLVLLRLLCLVFFGSGIDAVFDFHCRLCGVWICNTSVNRQSHGIWITSLHGALSLWLLAARDSHAVAFSSLSWKSALWGTIASPFYLFPFPIPSFPSSPFALFSTVIPRTHLFLAPECMHQSLWTESNHSCSYCSRTSPQVPEINLDASFLSLTSTHYIVSLTLKSSAYRLKGLSDHFGKVSPAVLLSNR